jgi:hypothetical protein
MDHLVLVQYVLYISTYNDNYYCTSCYKNIYTAVEVAVAEVVAGAAMAAVTMRVVGHYFHSL